MTIVVTVITIYCNVFPFEPPRHRAHVGNERKTESKWAKGGVMRWGPAQTHNALAHGVRKKLACYAE